MITEIGTLPAGQSSGTTAFTCNTPAIRVGAAPAYRTRADRPAIITLTGRLGFGNGAVAVLPSMLAGVVVPSPVPNSTTTEPRAAGLFVPFTELSWLRMAP